MIPAIDLTPPARRESRRFARRITGWCVAAAVYAALLAAAVVTLHLNHGQDAKAGQSVIDRARQRVDDLTAEAERTAQVAVVTARTVEAAERAGTHPNWALLLRAITAARGDEAVLEAVELKPLDPAVTPAPAPAPRTAADATRALPMGDAYALALRGIGVSHSAVLQFVARLEALGPLDSVDLVQTRRSLTAAATPGADAASAETWFELHCELLEQRDARPLTNAPSLPGVQPPRATAGVEDRP